MTLDALSKTLSEPFPWQKAPPSMGISYVTHLWSAAGEVAKKEPRVLRVVYVFVLRNYLEVEADALKSAWVAASATGSTEVLDEMLLLFPTCPVQECARELSLGTSEIYDGGTEVLSWWKRRWSETELAHVLRGSLFEWHAPLGYRLALPASDERSVLRWLVERSSSRPFACASPRFGSMARGSGDARGPTSTRSVTKSSSRASSTSCRRTCRTSSSPLRSRSGSPGSSSTSPREFERGAHEGYVLRRDALGRGEGLADVHASKTPGVVGRRSSRGEEVPARRGGDGDVRIQVPEANWDEERGVRRAGSDHAHGGPLSTSKEDAMDPTKNESCRHCKKPGASLMCPDCRCPIASYCDESCREADRKTRERVRGVGAGRQDPARRSGRAVDPLSRGRREAHRRAGLLRHCLRGRRLVLISFVRSDLNGGVVTLGLDARPKTPFIWSIKHAAPYLAEPRRLGGKRVTALSPIRTTRRALTGGICERVAVRGPRKEDADGTQG